MVFLLQQTKFYYFVQRVCCRRMKCLPSILSASIQHRCPHRQLKRSSDTRLLNKSQSASALFVKGKQGVCGDISIDVICLPCWDCMYVFFVYFQFISSVLVMAPAFSRWPLGRWSCLRVSPVMWHTPPRLACAKHHLTDGACSAWVFVWLTTHE